VGVILNRTVSSRHAASRQPPAASEQTLAASSTLLEAGGSRLAAPFNLLLDGARWAV